MYKILFEMFTFCLHTSLQTIRPSINKGAHSFHRYWRSCSNQIFFGDSPNFCVVLARPCFATITTNCKLMDLNLNFRRKIICSYETIHNTFKQLLGSFYRAFLNILLLHVCSNFNHFLTEVNRCNAFTGNSPPNH